MKRYILFVWGDVEPELRGPYASDLTRLHAARKLRKNDPTGRHGIYGLDVRPGGKPYVFVYCPEALDTLGLWLEKADMPQGSES